MQVVHWGRARKFFKEHKDAETMLKEWKAKVTASQWLSFSDIQQTFSSADMVDGKVVFDIRGNNYRLIAIVRFEAGKLYIQEIMTHKEYDKNRWKR